MNMEFTIFLIVVGVSAGIGLIWATNYERKNKLRAK